MDSESTTVKKGADGRNGGEPKKKAVTRSTSVGLQFPVGRIGRYLERSIRLAYWNRSSC